MVYVTAPTGIAAENVNGITLHSFAGCGLPRFVSDFDRCRARKAAKRWHGVNVLVVDEVSMLSGEFFDRLEEIARSIRCVERGEGIASSLIKPISDHTRTLHTHSVPVLAPPTPFFAPTHTHTHMHTCTHAHTHTCTQSYAITHTHQHTTPLYLPLSPPPPTSPPLPPHFSPLPLLKRVRSTVRGNSTHPLRRLLSTPPRQRKQGTLRRPEQRP
jgi:hypothetical protein